MKPVNIVIVIGLAGVVIWHLISEGFSPMIAVSATLATLVPAVVAVVIWNRVEKKKREAKKKMWESE